MPGTPVQPMVQRRITKDEFWALPEGPPNFEFEDGVLIPMPSPQHARHQDIASAFARILKHRLPRVGLAGVGLQLMSS